MSKVSPTNEILNYVGARAIPVMRNEIANGTGLSTDQVRKATVELVKQGRLTVERDTVGATYYALGRLKPAVEIKPEPKPRPIVVKDPIPTPTTQAWQTLVEEAEQRGFAKGYIKGVQEAQREAYEDGKRSVIGKLEALLT